MIASVLQWVGLLLFVVGVGLWSVPGAFVAAGIGVVLIGVALERGSDARTTD